MTNKKEKKIRSSLYATTINATYRTTKYRVSRRLQRGREWGVTRPGRDVKPDDQALWVWYRLGFLPQPGAPSSSGPVSTSQKLESLRYGLRLVGKWGSLAKFPSNELFFFLPWIYDGFLTTYFNFCSYSITCCSTYFNLEGKWGSACVKHCNLEFRLVDRCR